MVVGRENPNACSVIPSEEQGLRAAGRVNIRKNCWSLAKTKKLKAEYTKKLGSWNKQFERVLYCTWLKEC
ncbi:hypothetical protein EJB05_43059, partial [Eragrostis curvula]